MDANANPRISRRLRMFPHEQRIVIWMALAVGTLFVILG